MTCPVPDTKMKSEIVYDGHTDKNNTMIPLRNEHNLDIQLYQVICLRQTFLSDCSYHLCIDTEQLITHCLGFLVYSVTGMKF